MDSQNAPQTWKVASVVLFYMSAALVVRILAYRLMLCFRLSASD